MNELLKELCAIHSPSGSEEQIKNYILKYIELNKSKWKVKPKVYHGDGFQDCIVMVFGKPRTAVFAHIDSVGFTVKYGKELVKIGSPQVQDGYKLVGEDSKGNIECILQVNMELRKLYYDFPREIDRGTTLCFKPNYRAEGDFIISNYLDNRLGVYNALKLAETLQNGAIVFSCWEEHHGGSVPYLMKFLYENYKINKALISDITWITEGIFHGKGCVISKRDSGIPRQSFVNKIISIAKENNLNFQIEVEDAGGSDGQSIQQSPYPVDWCFIGAAEENVHSPDEKVHKADVDSMLRLYEILLETL